MKYGSICSGIEAATVAWEPLDWAPSFFSEIDEFPRAVLQHHYPDVPLHGDFTTIEEGQYDPIDLLVGGTPCQSFSVAGFRKGLDDERGNLTLEYLKLAARLRPQWLLWENVPGVLSQDRGRAFGSILGALVELGYGFAYRVLDAQYVRVDGYARAVPQRRRRLFLVGYLGGDWRPPAAVLFERESVRGDPPPRRPAREDVAPTLAARARGGGGLGTDHDLDGGLIPQVANPLTARMSKGINTTMDEGQTMVAQPIPFDTTQVTSPDNRSDPQPGDPYHPLTSSGKPPAIAFTSKDWGQDAEAEVAPTLRGMAHAKTWMNGGGQIAVTQPVADPIVAKEGETYTHEGRGNFRLRNVVASLFGQQWIVRRLTPRECERLQGFPDDYTAIPFGKKPVAANTRRYKALGNSMAVNCMRWIGTRLQMVNEILEDQE